MPICSSEGLSASQSFQRNRKDGNAVRSSRTRRLRDHWNSIDEMVLNANNSKLSALLDSRKEDVQDDEDDGTGGSVEVSHASCASDGDGRHHHRDGVGFLGRWRGKSSQSLDGTSHNHYFRQQDSNASRSSLQRTTSSARVSDEARRDLRNRSLQRTMSRLTTRRSRMGDCKPKEVKNDEDHSGDAEITVLDSCEQNDSVNPLEDHGMPAGCCVAQEQAPKQLRKNGVPIATVSDDSDDSLDHPIECNNGNGHSTHEERAIVPETPPVSRPALRRTMSTPVLQQSQVRSILKKSDSLCSTQPRGDKQQQEWSVQFDIVELREFDRTIGDNPSVSRGVPIGLDWNYNPMSIMKSLDDYEFEREPRRSRASLALSPVEREAILCNEWGITFSELHRTAMETDTIRYQRWQSANQNPAQQKREELIEATKRRVSKVFYRGKK